MAPSIVVKEKDIKDLDEGRMLCITDPKNNELTTVLSKHKVTIAGHILPTDKNRWIKKDTYKWETVVADTLFSLEYLNYKKDKKDLIIKTSSAKSVIKSRLGVRPNDVNYNALKKIIEKNGVTDFGYDVICSILDSGVRGTLKRTALKKSFYIDYILGKPFKYLCNVSDYANFYILMVEGEITLLRVGVDKTQVGFYDIVNSYFFNEYYNNRKSSEIFKNYLQTDVTELEIVNNKYINNKNYVFYNYKAEITAELFWLLLPDNSHVIKELAKGLDAYSDFRDGTNKVTEFSKIYKEAPPFPAKTNKLVLGEIYGHAYYLKNLSESFITGPKKSRLWIADVENSNTLSTKDWWLEIKQNQQNKSWENMYRLRNKAQIQCNLEEIL